MRLRRLRQRLVVEKPPDVTAPSSPVFGPISVPIRAMRASGAARLPTSHRLLPHMDPGMPFGAESARPLKLGTSQDEKTAEVMLVELLDRIQQVAVQSHQATESGAKSRVTVRRSVNVHPNGGIIRSAWSAHMAYPCRSRPWTRSSIHTELST